MLRTIQLQNVLPVKRIINPHTPCFIECACRVHVLCLFQGKNQSCILWVDNVTISLIST